MSETEFLLDEDHGNASFGITFFGDQPGIADAVGTLAVHAGSCLDARCMESAVSGRVLGSCNGPDPVHRRFDIRDNLVDSYENDYVFRAEIDASDSVANHIEVDQLPFLGQSVGSSQEQVGQQGLFAPVYLLRLAERGIECKDRNFIRLFSQLFQYTGGPHGHRVAPCIGPYLEGRKYLFEKNPIRLLGAFGQISVELILLQCLECALYKRVFHEGLK